MNSNKNFVLSLVTKTWIRDSHGLYDYESLQTKNLNAVLAESINISRIRHEIKTLSNEQNIREDEEILFKINNYSSDSFALENPVSYLQQPTEKNINDLSNKLWYILKADSSHTNNSNQTITNTNDDYYLCKNDIIKLGRVKYALNEVHVPSHMDSIDVVNNSKDKEKYDIDELNSNSLSVFDFIYQVNPKNECVQSEECLCKICYSGTNEPDNPMVHLCKCDGGLRFSHYKCIKEWMKTKLVIKENELKTVKSYNIKSFNCEICKTPYPFKFKIGENGKIFELIDIQKPEGDFIVLESLNQMKENCNIKSIHVIQLTDKDISIGRGHESDVRINDISVSRIHAILRYDPLEGKLLIRDLKSKFGTLILIKKPLKIKERKIHLQIGRTYMEVHLMTLEEFEELKRERKNRQKIKQELEKQSKRTNASSKEGSSGYNGSMHHGYMHHNSNNVIPHLEPNLPPEIQEEFYQFEGINQEELEMQNALAASLNVDSLKTRHDQLFPH